MKFTLDPPKPKINDVRTIKKFAWLPVTTTDGKIVLWLEKYLTKEKFFAYPYEFAEWHTLEIYALKDKLEDE